MTDAQLFDLANGGALLGWLALACAPLRREPLVAAARGVSVALAVFYAVVLGAGLWAGRGDGGLAVDFTSLAGVTALFTQPRAVLAGWAHYLAFDLWVVAWATEDAGRAGVPHWLLLACLLLIFLAGPLGLLLYLVARTAGRGRRRRRA